MTQQETLDRILLEVRTHSIPASDDYIPTLDHYMSVKLFSYYAKLIYAIGCDEGRREHTRRTRIRQMKDGIEIKIWESQADAARALKVGVPDINKALRHIHNRKKCKGFEWEYY
jgi:hypothetical protein